MTKQPQNSSNDKWTSARECLTPSGVLSVIMPCFNLTETIADNLKRVHNLLDGHIPFEIIAVDDGSSDGSAAAIREAAESLPSVVPLILPRNLGKGGALRNGAEQCRGSHILLIDADLDIPPHQLNVFFDVMLEKKADIVIGSKRHPDSQVQYPWHRHITSAVYYSMVKLIVGLPVRDTQTGMKLFRSEALKYAFTRMLVKRFAFDLEILSIAHEEGYKIAEAPVIVDFKGNFGCLNWKTIKQITIDTLAIFYRLRWLRYYQSLEPRDMPTPAPMVSVVIACPAPTGYLDECLQGLSRQGYKNFEIIILPDEASEREWPEGTREIATGAIRPADKRNIGIEAAHGEMVALLDDDTWPVNNWLERAIPYFSDPTVGAVGGPASTPHKDTLMAKAGGKVYANFLVSGNVRYRYEPDRVREVDDFPSCNLVIRTDVLRKLNGFNTEFWPGEDTILCMQLVHDLKLRIIYDPWVQVYHHRRPLLLPHLRQVGRYALHRGYFARRFPATSRRISYMLPSIFVVGLVAGALVSPFSVILSIMYLICLGIYLTLTLLSAISLSPVIWLSVWIGVIFTHLVYGVRFIQGLLSRSMPGEVSRFDHPSEKPSP